MDGISPLADFSPPFATAAYQHSVTHNVIGSTVGRLEVVRLIEPLGTNSWEVSQANNLRSNPGYLGQALLARGTAPAVHSESGIAGQPFDPIHRRDFLEPIPGGPHAYRRELITRQRHDTGRLRCQSIALGHCKVASTQGIGHSHP